MYTFNNKQSNILLFAFITNIILLTLTPQQLWGQEIKWYEQAFENVRVSFPSEEVYEIDTMEQGYHLRQLHSMRGNSVFMVQKMTVANTNRQISALPHDHASLIKNYDEFVQGMQRSMGEEVKLTKEEIRLGHLIGYKVLFNNAEDELLMEARVFLANRDLIMMGVYHPEQELPALKEQFFESLELENMDAIKQYIGKSGAYGVGKVLGKLFFWGVLGGALFLIFRAFREKY